MLAKLQRSLSSRLPHHSIVYAYSRAAVSRHSLPPGKLVRLDQVEKADRGFLLRRSAELGPIFKAIGWNEFWICFVGLPLGRRLLRDCAIHLKPITLDLGALFPKGFLRQMQGEDHQKYRKALNRAIKPADLTENTPGLEAIAARALAAYAETEDDHHNSADAYIATLNSISTEMMIQLFFGAHRGAAGFDRLIDGYRKLGPYGLVWNIGERQKSAFAEIRDCLRELFSGDPNKLPPQARQSVLGRMVEEGQPDETMLGNLIYMVEMGRYDSYSLLRWLTKHGADHAPMLDRIAGEGLQENKSGKTFCEAVVLETLRMDQSERLMRRAQRDFVFDGHLIPKYATVRVCLWESHKSPETFPSPFDFDPSRFLVKGPTSDEFAPFGLDHHRCPFGEMSIRMSVVFLRVLARHYTVSPGGDGLPVRGAYHWEPASKFGVKLHSRIRPGIA